MRGSSLLIRYRRSEDGKPVAKAVVYTQEEHHIEKGRLDPDALRIVERLRENGHEAYIVGGAVRDLLLGRRPKDFDIVTDAQPTRIKRVFRNSRVIGRRFRLVHVYAGSKIFEVSTFRSIANGTVGNEFGTMDEDAFRRDFTLNALYYDPVESILVDYVGGFKDIAAKKVVPVIHLKDIFREDPVRMIRCVKYATTSGFRIPFWTRRAIRRDAVLLAGASPSRLTEEFVKILGSGVSSLIIPSLATYRLLGHIVPEAARLMDADSKFGAALRVELADLDEEARNPSRERRLSASLAAFLAPRLLGEEGLVADRPDSFSEALQAARAFLNPLNLPRVELEAAVLSLFERRKLNPNLRWRRGAEGEDEGPRRPRRRRRKGPGEASPDGQAPRPGPQGGSEPRPPAKAGPASGGQARPRLPRKDGPQAPKAGEAGHPEIPLPGGEASQAKKRRRRRRKPGKPADGAPRSE